LGRAALCGWARQPCSIIVSRQKNALAKAVFFNRLGEMRDRSFENQRYRSRSRSLNIAGHPKRVVQMIVPEVQLEEWPP
jgi:hypothetical protein